MRRLMMVVGWWVLLVGAAAAQLPPAVGRDVIHVVGPQERTEVIAHRYGLALEHVAFANGIDIDQYVPEVSPGVPLVIPERRILPLDPPRDGIVLNIPERGLFLFLHGHFVHFYPVAVGRPHFETPRGQFSIINKVVNPTWVPPSWAHVSKTIYVPGPDNPLGDRWIGLSAHGVGIHGTVSPDAIGMNISHGCIRMYPDFEHALFDQVTVGLPVRIEYEPVKVGRDVTTGQVCVAIFPDVYGLVDIQQRARTMLSPLGVPSERIDILVHQATGRAMDVSTDPIVVKADDLDVAAAADPIRRNGTLWLPLEVVKAANIYIDQSAADSVTLTWQSHSIQLPFQTAAPDDVTQAYAWHGHVYVSAVHTLQTLALPYRWLASSATLWIRPEVPSVSIKTTP